MHCVNFMVKLRAFPHLTFHTSSEIFFSKSEIYFFILKKENCTHQLSFSAVSVGVAPLCTEWHLPPRPLHPLPLAHAQTGQGWQPPDDSTPASVISSGRHVGTSSGLVYSLRVSSWAWRCGSLRFWACWNFELLSNLTWLVTRRARSKQCWFSMCARVVAECRMILGADSYPFIATDADVPYPPLFHELPPGGEH